MSQKPRALLRRGVRSVDQEVEASHLDIYAVVAQPKGAHGAHDLALLVGAHVKVAHAPLGPRLVGRAQAVRVAHEAVVRAAQRDDRRPLYVQFGAHARRALRHAPRATSLQAHGARHRLVVSFLVGRGRGGARGGDAARAGGAHATGVVVAHVEHVLRVRIEAKATEGVEAVERARGRQGGVVADVELHGPREGGEEDVGIRLQGRSGGGVWGRILATAARNPHEQGRDARPENHEGQCTHDPRLDHFSLSRGCTK